MRVCVCVCVYLSVYVDMWAYSYVYVHAYVCVCLHVSVSVCVCVCVCVCVSDQTQEVEDIIHTCSVYITVCTCVRVCVWYELEPNRKEYVGDDSSFYDPTDTVIDSARAVLDADDTGVLCTQLARMMAVNKSDRRSIPTQFSNGAAPGSGRGRGCCQSSARGRGSSGGFR